jgi:hypothetical protein
MKLKFNYKIDRDENNVILRFEEKRTRINNEKKEVEFLHTDSWFYPNLKMALKAYLNKIVFDSATNEDTSASTILRRIGEVEELIQSLKAK